MAILPFRKDLYDRGYIITSGFMDLSKIGEYSGTELKMAPTLYERSNRPAGQSLESLIKKATTIEGDLEEGMKRDYDIDFFANYPAIFCEKRIDWCLNAVEITYCCIKLYYVNREGGDGILTIANPDDLQLTFTAPRSRLGFNPKCQVTIVAAEFNTAFAQTRIIADFGYMVNDGKIYLKDPKQGNCYGNLYIVGEEYTGL